MFILEYQRPEQATGAVADVYGHFLGRTSVPAPLQLLSASPALLALQFDQIRYFMGHERLTFPMLAAIRFLASEQICFDHCRSLNTQWLIKSGLGREDVENLARGKAVDAFSDEENALLQVVRKVLARQRISAGDVRHLRELGWRDADILDACAQGTNLIAAAYLYEAFQES